jgi:hypothetical protein
MRQKKKQGKQDEKKAKQAKLTYVRKEILQAQQVLVNISKKFLH